VYALLPNIVHAAADGERKAAPGEHSDALPAMFLLVPMGIIGCRRAAGAGDRSWRGSLVTTSTQLPTQRRRSSRWRWCHAS
jgi:hypothetical protein